MKNTASGCLCVCAAEKSVSSSPHTYSELLVLDCENLNVYYREENGFIVLYNTCSVSGIKCYIMFLLFRAIFFELSKGMRRAVIILFTLVCYNDCMHSDLCHVESMICKC